MFCNSKSNQESEMKNVSYFLSELNRSGIPDLLDNVSSAEQWEEKRRAVLAEWMKYIGSLPARQDVSWEVLSEARLDGHYQIHLRYVTAFEDQVTAYLLLPLEYYEEPNKSGQRFPAIMALHPTNAEGKADIGTAEGRENRQYGLELVLRGYVVLVPDTITAGERIYTEAFQTAPFYAEFPEWSAVGKMLIDHMYGVDLLCSLEQVDPQRIGAIGHSLGGYNAFFLAGIDRRIRALVSSCGFSTFAGDALPNRWGLRDWFSHIPKLTADIHNGIVPFEFNEIAALAAPTPAFYWSGQQDKIFPHWRQISEAMENVKKLYTFLGEEEAFLYLMGSTGHDFPNYIRSAAYQFLDRWLK